MKLGCVIHNLEVCEYQHSENAPPSFLFFKQRNTRDLKHPLEPPIRARPPVEFRGGVPAEIKTDTS